MQLQVGWKKAQASRRYWSGDEEVPVGGLQPPPPMDPPLLLHEFSYKEVTQDGCLEELRVRHYIILQLVKVKVLVWHCAR